MKQKILMGVGLFLLILLMCSTSYAIPTFYLSTGSAVDGDLTFQSSVSGNTFIEEDFDNYSNGTLIESLTYGGVDIGISASSIAKPASFWGAWGSNSQYGTVYEGALERNTFDTNSNFLSFSFSGADVVQGFGVWVFDDSADRANSFTMTVEGLDGNMWESGVLDANPDDASHAIEGFIGVHFIEGISSITINNAEGACFEIDHMQIASSPVPEPATILLLGSGLAGLAFYRRKRK